MVDNTLDAANSAPAPTLSSGDVESDLTAGSPTLSSGDVQADLTAPAPTLASTGDDPGADIAAPAPTLVATMPLESAAVDADLLAPAPSLVASGIAGNVLTVVEAAPAPILSAVLDNPAIITSALDAPAPILDSSFLTGEVMTAALTAASPIMAAAGYQAYTLSATLVAPVPQLIAVLDSTVASGYRGWVLNTRKLALSEYGSEFAFNSFAQFGDQALACGPSGVVVLGTQGLDDTAPITARVRTGADGFESSLLKRVPRLYTSYSSDGDMLFRTITAENGTRTYSLPFNGSSELQQRRVPVGKGPKSRFWSFELENVDGADFDINDLSAYPTKLRRRVQ